MSTHREILDRLEFGVVLHGADSRIMYANPAAQRILALAEAELLDRDSHDPEWGTIHPDGSPFPSTDHPAVAAAREGTPIQGVVMGVSQPATRDRIWLVVSASPFDSEDGEREVLVTFNEITATEAKSRALEEVNETLSRAVAARTSELRGALEALEASDANYRGVIRAMAEGVAIHAPDGSILSANPAAERILGLSVDQMQGRHPMHPDWELCREDGTPLPADEIPSEITRSTGLPCANVVLRVRRGSGDLAWLSVNTDPVRYQDGGELKGVVATFTDVTVERRALAELERSRDRLQRLNETLPGVLFENIYGHDLALRKFAYVSPQIEQLFGIPAQELMDDIGRLGRVIHPDDLPKVQHARRTALEAGEPIEVDCRVEVGDEWRWARIRSGAPTPIQDGFLVRAIVLDITEERRLAHSLREAQRQEGMGALAAGIAHNFNNMLAAILPNLDALKEVVPESGQEDLQVARRAAGAASELVRQLMRLARRDTTRETESVDIVEVVREAESLCRRTFDKKIDIEVDVPLQPLLVSGPRGELQQVLVNLLINARDALEGETSPRISIEVQQVDGKARVRVQDNGTGMSEAIQARLGEPFFTTKEPGTGTGLGMATVFGIVRECGGTIDWESELGAGSTFELGLPVAAATADATEGDPDSGMPRTFSGRSVLVIDDEPLVRRSVGKMLTRLGLSVFQVDGGPAGLDLLSDRDDVDLVLLDLSMPGMSGGEVLEAIREKDRALPVIIMSGYIPDPEDYPTATGILVKPFAKRDLVAQLAGALPDHRI